MPAKHIDFRVVDDYSHSTQRTRQGGKLFKNLSQGVKHQNYICPNLVFCLSSHKNNPFFILAFWSVWDSCKLGSSVKDLCSFFYPFVVGVRRNSKWFYGINWLWWVASKIKDSFNIMTKVVIDVKRFIWLWEISKHWNPLTFIFCSLWCLYDSWQIKCGGFGCLFGHVFKFFSFSSISSIC